MYGTVAFNRLDSLLPGKASPRFCNQGTKIDGWAVQMQLTSNQALISQDRLPHLDGMKEWKCLKRFWKWYVLDLERKTFYLVTHTILGYISSFTRIIRAALSKKNVKKYFPVFDLFLSWKAPAKDARNTYSIFSVSMSSRNFISTGERNLIFTAFSRLPAFPLITVTISKK